MLRHGPSRGARLPEVILSRPSPLLANYENKASDSPTLLSLFFLSNGKVVPFPKLLTTTILGYNIVAFFFPLSSFPPSFLKHPPAAP